MRNKEVIKITASAMFIALVFVATYINVPFPGAAGGLVHLGTLMMLIVAMRFGKYFGMLAGGIGMAMFDVFSPWVVWAPGTLVVRLVMGFVVGYLAYDATKGQGAVLWKNMIAWAVGLVVMVVGYYFYEALFLTDFYAALASIWGNVIQFGIGLIAPFAAVGLSKIHTIDEYLTL